MLGKVEKAIFGPLWRSEDMKFVRITTQRDVTHEFASRIGEAGLIEFVDLEHDTAAFKRTFFHQVKDCEELERKLRYFSELLRKAKLKKHNSVHMTERNIALSMDSFEQNFSNFEKELREMSANLEQLQAQKLKAEEMGYVIEKGSEIIRQGMGATEDTSQNSSSDMMDSDSKGTLGKIVGVIRTDKIPTFNLLIYRATRGNVIPRYAEIAKPVFDLRENKEVQKTVFVVYFGANFAKEKIKKICESLGASTHEYPDSSINDARDNVASTLRQLQNTIAATEERRNEILYEIMEQIQDWKKWLAKEKAIYHTMNMFKFAKSRAQIEGWVAAKNLAAVEAVLSDADAAVNSPTPSLLEELQTEETPPTYFETNDLTRCYQDIVNAYGIPRYKEVNPAPISIITFPFLFAVMFGDYGHGIILLLFSLFLLIFQKKIAPIAERSEMVGMVFSGRWVLFLMSLFSIYTGLLYNDCFGLQFNIFGTAYDFPEHEVIGEKVRPTYVFGVDVAWFGTLNKLMMYNSIKMKMAIVFGVVQMMVGIFFSFLNHIQERHYEDIFFEFIPEVLLLGCTFGYMSFMIIFKWCVNWEANGWEAPGLLPTMTDFFLHPYGLQQPALFNGQLIVQLVCLGLAAVSVPVLLIPKPIYELIHHKLHHKKSQGVSYGQLDEEQPNDNEKSALNPLDNNAEEVNIDDKQADKPEEKKVDDHSHATKDKFNFSEIFIKQLIHTIEFALGTVSNTASYLRLWALSLAHSQLSEVFWDMTIKLILTLDIASMPALKTGIVYSGVGFVVVFAIWLALTIGVLCSMESLSAFLHALRLHWVEFQNKFYKGDGHLFAPFSVTVVYKQLEKAEMEEEEKAE